MASAEGWQVGQGEEAAARTTRVGANGTQCECSVVGHSVWLSGACSVVVRRPQKSGCERVEVKEISVLFVVFECSSASSCVLA